MKLSLRRKIAGGFGLLLALVAVLIWVTLSLFGSLRTVQRNVFNDAVPGLVAVDEIVRSYTAQSAAVRGYLNEGDSTLLAQYRSEVAESDVWQSRARDFFTTREERALLTELVEAGAAFQNLVEKEVIPFTARGKRIQAIRVLGQDGSPLISEIETLGAFLREAQDREVAQAEAKVRSNSDEGIVILLLAAIGVFGLGVFIAWVLPRRLVAQLSRLVDAARAIGRGDLDQKLDIRSGDEVEELAQRFVEMQAGLKRLQQLALQDRELEIAATIQRNLSQRTLPDTPGARLVPLQRQANLVGGDWYDVDHSGATLTVAVGDASGKGIGAALMATVALSVLRAERGRGTDAKKIIERANHALKDATDADSFTTCIYATFDLPSGEVRWFNMGHPSPLVLRAAGKEGDPPRGYFLEGPRNRALGWYDDPGSTETMLRLHPGDRLVMYTDGFLEAKDPEGEVFGSHRFAEALSRLAPLPSEALEEQLVEDVERFAAGKLDDDLTMLVIEFQGAPVPEPTATEATEEAQWHSRR